MNRWGIFLDVEGVSKIYPSDAGRFYNAFNELLSAVCLIGNLAYPEKPYRLFAHQVGGDGLIIVSEFAEGKPEVPISISVLLMQVLLVNNAVAKAGISEGDDFGDVVSCYPSLQSCPCAGDRIFRLGRGLLTIFPVMGTVLINAHRFAQEPRGCRLAVDKALLDTTPSGVIVTHSDSDLVIVDWVHTRTSIMEFLLAKTGLQLPSAEELETKLVSYIRSTGNLGKNDWGRNSLLMNGCPWTESI